MHLISHLVSKEDLPEKEVLNCFFWTRFILTLEPSYVSAINLPISHNFHFIFLVDCSILQMYLDIDLLS